MNDAPFTRKKFPSECGLTSAIRPSNHNASRSMSRSESRGRHACIVSFFHQCDKRPTYAAKQRYKLGLGTVVEVTQSEVAVTAAETRLAEAQYDYKIAEVTLAYSAGGRSQLEIDSTLH